MKRFLSIVCLALLGACTTVAPGTPTSTTAATPTVVPTAQQKLLYLATAVNKQCTVALPFLASMVTIQTDPAALKIATDANTYAIQICGAASGVVKAPAGMALPTSFTLADVQTFVNTNIPQVLTLIKNASKLTPADKTGMELAVTGAQTVLAIAVANAQ